MNPGKPHQETPRPSHGSHGFARRRSNFSLSFALRSPKNRASVLNMNTSEPTCQERIHYPVYDPDDPRHNPSRRRHDSQNSSADSQKQAHWVQDLQKRSIHKVRSGLLSLREGLLRLSSWNDGDSDDTGSMLVPPRTHGSEGRNRAYGVSGVSDTSTQEDLSFGVGMYRMNSPWPTTFCGPGSNGSTRVASSLVLPNVSALDLRASSGPLHPESPLFRQGNLISNDPPPYSASYDRPFADGVADTRTDQERPLVDPERSFDGVLREHSIRSDVSGWETISSGMESASSVNGDVSGARGSCDNNMPAERPHTAVTSSEIPANAEREKSNSSGLSRKGTRSDDSLTIEETTNSSTGSFKLPDPGAPSVFGPSKVDHPLAKIRESEALVTQEHLYVHRRTSEEANTSPIAMSRKCSANVVKIAFPGVYHALLEQWTRETRNVIVNSAEIAGVSTASYIPDSAAGQGQQDLDYQDLPWSCENRAHRLPANASTGHRTWGSSEAFSSGEQNSTTIEDIWVQAGLSSRLRTSRAARIANLARSSSTAHAHPSAEMPELDTRHSFGLHITQRSESSGEKTSSNDQNHQDNPRRSLNQQAFQQAFQQAPKYDQYTSLSALVTSGPLGSPFNRSECSSGWTMASSLSPGATSGTCISDSPWSPMDSPAGEEVLFSNTIWRDEYYMADGKTSNHYHDRGDQPTKRLWRQRLTDDGSIHSGPGLDRTPSSRLHVSELMAPVALPHPCTSLPNRPRDEREGPEQPQENLSEHQAQTRCLG